MPFTDIELGGMGCVRGSILLVAALLFSGNACAMNAPDNHSTHCRVVGGEKLPRGSGGTVALCSAIEQAVSGRAPGKAVTVEVRVLPNSMLAATLTVNGRALPEQKFASMDRDLDSHSFERFANALAEQVAKDRP
jgi:hypothetical protein